MSLWEKWEREKLERMGIEVERKSDVYICDTRPKPNVRKQALILGAAVVACFLVVYFFLTLNERYGWRWEDLYVVRLIAEKSGDRIAEQNGSQLPY
ncbi:MAG: hypothetical protein FWG71_10180 [Synergistaceae bacterium]|nr:hypothetical protein [Synergistaceae bacterium]